MANQALQVDSGKMMIFLQSVGIKSSVEQDRIIQEVQTRNAGIEPHLREIQAPNREAIALASLPKEAISPDTNLPLMADLADGKFVPRIGAFLVENSKYQERISKTVIIKKPCVVKNLHVDKVRGVLENSSNLNKKIEASHVLSQLSNVEKTMLGVGQFDIVKYNPSAMSWIQLIDGGHTELF